MIDARTIIFPMFCMQLVDLSSVVNCGYDRIEKAGTAGTIRLVEPYSKYSSTSSIFVRFKCRMMQFRLAVLYIPTLYSCCIFEGESYASELTKNWVVEEICLIDTTQIPN